MSNIELAELTAISPVDGRYGNKTKALRAIFSEFGLTKARVNVEVEWLQALANEPAINELPALQPAETDFLSALVQEFSVSDAASIKARAMAYPIFKLILRSRSRRETSFFFIAIYFLVEVEIGRLTQQTIRYF